jgi:hypothetical protein
VDEDLTRANWRKSTYSNGSGGDCTECAVLPGGHVGVRDSKQGAEGAVLIFTAAEWRAFLLSVRGRDGLDSLA